MQSFPSTHAVAAVSFSTSGSPVGDTEPCLISSMYIPGTEGRQRRAIKTASIVTFGICLRKGIYKFNK